MNIKQANQIPITGVLEQLGHQPVYVRSSGDLRYFSPFRSEDTPSFDVKPQDNIWYDFGTGEWGDTVKLITVMDRCSTSQALATLEGYRGIGGIQSVDLPLLPDAPSPVTTKARQTRQSRESGIEILEVRPLKHKALVQYVEGRGIPATLATRYLRETTYQLAQRDKASFGLAFENRSGGLEIRSKYDKLSASPKDVTMIGMQLVNDEMVLFEGFMDMLSWLAHYGKTRFHLPVMVINGVSNKHRAASMLDILGVKKAQCYLDRDAGGQEILTRLKELEAVECVDQSSVYEGYNDFNDMLMNAKITERP